MSGLGGLPAGQARSLGGLQVPAASPAAIQAAAGRTPAQLKAAHDGQTAGHPGVVQWVSGGSAQVLISSDYKLASVSPTAKAVQAGDAVKCEKRGGTWWVVAVDTWHEPPMAAAPPSGPIPAASTVSGQTVNELAFNPQAPASNVGSTLESVITWGTNTRAHLLNLEAWLTALRTQVNRLRDNDISARGGINSNASATNSAGSIITGTRDATSALRAGALQDRIIT